MSHSPIIIDEIERLQAEAGAGSLSDALGDLNSKYVAANALLDRQSPPLPPFHVMMIHELLKDIDKWVHKATAADEDFVLQLSYYNDQLDYWLNLYP